MTEDPGSMPGIAGPSLILRRDFTRGHLQGFFNPSHVHIFLPTQLLTQIW